MIPSQLLLAAALTLGWQSGGTAPAPIHVESVLVTLIEQVEVPAQEAGVLMEIAVREGEIVEEDTLLARLQDAEALLAHDRAKIELDIALKQAKNQVRIRFAQKSLEVAKAERRRATESVEKFRKSVSESELDKLRLEAERAALEIEQIHEDLDIAKLTAALKENEFATADRDVRRRKITAPIAGAVVEIKRRKGEWVEPGESVIRILRIDSLRAEGFVDAGQVRGNLSGAPVTLFVDLPDRPQEKFEGSLVFISPEIDPVNGQIRVWAEVENRDLLLRPGMQASMEIQTPATAQAKRESK